MVEPQQAQMKRAIETPMYREMMLAHLDVLTVLYRDLLEDECTITINDESRNKCLAEMLVVIKHIKPKLEGSGERATKLLQLMVPFEPWIRDILTAKTEESEYNRIHQLFELIVRSYDLLGWSNI